MNIPLSTAALGILFFVGVQVHGSDALVDIARGNLPPEPVLDINLNSFEYTGILDFLKKKNPKQYELEDILQLGARNLDWLIVINSSRPISQRLTYSTNYTTGYPITSPHFYNVKIIKERFKKFQAQVPRAMADVLFSKKQLPPHPQVDDVLFSKFGKEMDAIYQMASRWTLMEPHLNTMTAYMDFDLRGFYNLYYSPKRQEEMKNWTKLNSSDKAFIKTALLQMCRNNQIKFCEDQIYEHTRKNTVYNFYNSLIPGSLKLWNSYFELNIKRNDTSWDSRHNILSIPFRNPRNINIENFVKINIQDEWRWGTWQLILNFVSTTSNDVPFIQFIPRATPHVDKVGGNEITMDLNAPISEFDVQWTIRHEFGHVLGFRDCYIEFYDFYEKVMVNYQLDVTNLMCSRSGHLKEVHYMELKRVYGGP